MGYCVILLWAYAYLAGVVTVLSPCALPLLPVLLAGSGGGSMRPWGIVTGFVGGFLAFALGFAWLIQGAGFPPDTLRWAAGVVLAVFGLVTAVPLLQRAFQAWLAPLVVRRSRVPVGAKPRGGFGPGVLIGLGLGLSWSPCVGPIMASVLTLALTQSVTVSAAAVALAFSLGTGSAFLPVMLGGRTLLKRMPGLVKHTEALQRVFGGLMILAGVAILAGWDRDFSAWVLRAFPGYAAGLTGWEESPAVLEQVEDWEP